jgi:hypothetical protein
MSCSSARETSHDSPLHYGVKREDDILVPRVDCNDTHHKNANHLLFYGR